MDLLLRLLLLLLLLLLLPPQGPVACVFLTRATVDGLCLALSFKVAAGCTAMRSFCGFGAPCSVSIRPRPLFFLLPHKDAPQISPPRVSQRWDARRRRSPPPLCATAASFEAPLPVPLPSASKHQIETAVPRFPSEHEEEKQVAVQQQQKLLEDLLLSSSQDDVSPSGERLVCLVPLREASWCLLFKSLLKLLLLVGCTYRCRNE